MIQIKVISSDGIEYKDEFAKTSFVDFQQCNDNWIQYRKRSEKLSDDEVSQLRGIDKCVGQRDSTVEPMYFEFFTRPFTRLEIESKDTFQELRDKIIAAGWNTIDLS